MVDINPGVSAFTRTNSFEEEKERCFPEFFVDAVLDDLASARNGHPVYRDEERVRIFIPANPYTSPVHRVTDEHRQRWPKQYEAFKKGTEVAHEGLPVELWPILTKAQVKWLKHHNIHTVEACASLADYALQTLGMGGRTLKNKAQAYFDDAKRLAMVESLDKENERLALQVEGLTNQVGELKKALDTLHARSMVEPVNPISTHVPGQHDPFAGFATPGQASLAPVDPLASLAALEERGKAA